MVCIYCLKLLAFCIIATDLFIDVPPLRTYLRLVPPPLEQGSIPTFFGHG